MLSFVLMIVSYALVSVLCISVAVLLFLSQCSCSCSCSCRSVLILVAMFFGMAKFDEFLQLLGIATNILGERLSLLVQYQVVTKQAYQNNPVRYRYLLTERGEDLYGFVMAVWQWAKTWTDVGESENGLVHNCGKPLVVDVSCGACSSSLSLV